VETIVEARGSDSPAMVERPAGRKPADNVGKSQLIVGRSRAGQSPHGYRVFALG
jgi:hypothetical protein